MSRTVSATISSAVEKAATAPVYLIEILFDEGTEHIATWDADISWNGQTWVKSGVQITGVSAAGARMVMPTGTSDPWMSLILNYGARDTAINIYEHHTDATASPQSDAVLVFTGIMDAVDIGNKMVVKIIESSRAKAFPALNAEPNKFTHLMKAGDTIIWGSDVITVQ